MSWLLQGANTALGNLPGTQESAAMFQGYCEEALSFEAGQYCRHMHRVDQRSKG